MRYLLGSQSSPDGCTSSEPVLGAGVDSPAGDWQPVIDNTIKNTIRRAKMLFFFIKVPPYFW
jgi:hypothetical protein